MNQLNNEPNVIKYRIRIGKGSLQILHGDQDFRLKLTCGWRYLCALLESPGLAFRPWQLEQPESDHANNQGSYTVLDAAQNADLYYCDLLPSLPLTDARTIFEIKQRLIFIMNAIAIAQDCCDPGKLDDLLTEKEKLKDYLMEVYSPKGRNRDFPSEQQKQQRRVNRYIHRALKQLEPWDPFLAQHLASHLKLGSFLLYCPGELEITVQRN